MAEGSRGVTFGGPVEGHRAHARCTRDKRYHPSAPLVAEFDMNSVRRLQDCRFPALPQEERRRVLGLGPPRPDVIIRQLVNKGRGKHSYRYFKNEWYRKVTWICSCPDRKALFCFSCLLFGGEASWTRKGVTDIKHLNERIRQHETSRSHITNFMEWAVLGRCTSVTFLSNNSTTT